MLEHLPGAIQSNKETLEFLREEYEEVRRELLDLVSSLTEDEAENIEDANRVNELSVSLNLLLEDISVIENELKRDKALLEFAKDALPALNSIAAAIEIAIENASDCAKDPFEEEEVLEIFDNISSLGELYV